jgi:hypothetical protein
MVATAETQRRAVGQKMTWDPLETRRLVAQNGENAFSDSDSDENGEDEDVLIKPSNPPGKWNWREQVLPTRRAAIIMFGLTSAALLLAYSVLAYSTPLNVPQYDTAAVSPPWYPARSWLYPE